MEEEREIVIEEWRDIKGYEGIYKVSNLGGVKKNVNQEWFVRKSSILKSGYAAIQLRKGKEKQMFRVHRLVALAFIPNPENKSDVNHIDGDKLNNCLENLEWATRLENMKHASEKRLMPHGVKNTSTKLNDQKIREIRSLRKTNPKQYTYKKLSEIYKVNTSSIGFILTNKIWQHVQ